MRVIRARTLLACALGLLFGLTSGVEGLPRGKAAAKTGRSAPVTVLVKLQPALADEVESALPLDSLTLHSGRAPERAQAFLQRHSGQSLTPLYREIVRQKKQRNWSDRQIASATAQRFAARARRRSGPFEPPAISRTYELTLEISARQRLPQVLAELQADPEVEFAEANKVVSLSLTTNDPYLSSSGSWGQAFDDLWGIKDVGAPAAWDNTTGLGVVVAVVDSGTDITHADISTNLWQNSGEIPNNFIDDDGNGYFDDVHGWNFAYYSGTPNDDHGHGTHVAGTIAAVGNNGTGVVGVAWRAKLMTLKALDSQGNGYDSALANSIIYAAANGADVINASWGAPGSSQTITDAIAYAHSLGAVIVAAAGNDGVDAMGYYPANLPQVITVSASQYGGAIASFSNRGSKIDVAAPGVQVLSLRAAGTSMPTPLNTGYTYANGTSMAAPHVSGVAALVLAARPTYTNEQVRQVLRSSALDLGTTGYDLTSGYGGVNAAAALTITNPLEVKITAPPTGTTATGAVEITGFARGNGFASYTLEYGAGTLPTIWNIFHSSAVPTTGVLGVFDPTTLSDGTYTVRLTAYPASGGPSVDRIQIMVKTLAISAPLPGFAKTSATTFKPGAVVRISGTAIGNGFQNFQVQWARGYNASAGWQTAGISLTGNGLVPLANVLLATWNTAGITEADYYTIRLVVTRGGVPSEVRTTVYLEPDLISVNWPRFLDSGPNTHSGVLPAHDAQGRQRLVLAAPGRGTNPAVFWRVSLDGSAQKHTLPGSSYGSAHQPSVANLDGLPGDETVVANGYSVRVYRPDNSSFELPMNPAVYVYNAQLTVADLNGDSQREIVAIGSDFNNKRAYIYAWRPDGSLLPNFPVYIADYNSISSYLNKVRLLVADVDGDGTKEIVVSEGLTASTFALRIIGSNGVPRTWSAPVFDGLPFALAAADLDHVGKLNVIVVALVGTQPNAYVLQPDGSVRAGWPVPLADYGEYGQAWIAIGDLDRNGQEEIVISRERQLNVLRADGSQYSAAWPLVTTTRIGHRAVVLADVDGDGTQEIVTTRSDVVADSYYDQKLLAVRLDGSIARSWQLTGADGYSLAGDAQPAIGDFNDDGKLDIAVAYAVTAPGDLVPGVVTILTTGTPYSAAAHDWPMIHRNSRNPGVLTRTSGVISLSTTALAFEQAAGTTSAPQTVTVSNTGSGPVTIENIVISGHSPRGMFAGLAQTNNCGTRLAAGASCTISMTFSPPFRGASQGMLKIFHDAPSSVDRISIQASGISPRKNLPIPRTGGTGGSTGTRSRGPR